MNKTPSVSAPLPAGGYYTWALAPLPVTASRGRVFVFSGQGSAVPGMLAGLVQNPIIAHRLAIADRLALAAGLACLSDYCLAPEGLDDDEKKEIELFALYAAQVALCEALVAEGHFPCALTSHSFGEYAALVAAGIVSFSEGFQILVARERVCPPPNQVGYLLAIWGEAASLAKGLGDIPYQVALQNSPSQTVVAVSWDALLLAERRLTESGTRFRRLALPQPYHSPALEGAAAQLSVEIPRLGIREQRPRFPFFSSVLHSWWAGPDLLPTCMARQLTEPVDFIAQVKALSPLATQFVEIGGRPVVASFLREMTQAPGTPVDTAFSLLSPSGERAGASDWAHASTLSEFGPIREKVVQLIAKVTGYRIEEIRLEDRIQEDLGIDSLKTAEILIQLAASSPAPQSRRALVQTPRTVAEMVSLAMGEVPKTGGEEEQVPKVAQWRRSVLAFCDVPLARETVGAAEDYAFHSINEILDGMPLTGKKKGIIARRSSFSATEPGVALQTLCLALRDWRAREPSGEIIYCIESQASVLAQAAVGVFKSLRKEWPGITVRICHADTLPDLPGLVRRVGQELAWAWEWESDYVGDRRRVPWFGPAPDPAPGPFPKRVLAIGGAKGIVAALIEALPWPEGSQIFLWGRQKTLTPEQEEWLVTLRQRGIAVQYASVNVENRDEIQSQLQFLKSLPGGICQIWNGAGLEMSRDLAFKTSEEIQREFSGKFTPAVHLAWLCQQIPVRRFIQMSSVIAWHGNHGQSIYAAANLAADAELERSLRHACALTVMRWPPWDGVGMTANPVIHQTLKTSGVSLLSRERAAAFFLQEITACEPQHDPVYYYDNQDDPLYRFPCALGKEPALRVGKPVVSAGGLSFSQVFTRGSEPFLWDHCVGGNLVFPAALGVSLMLEASRAFQLETGELRDFQVRRPLISRHGAMAVVVGGIKKEGGVSLTLGNPGTGFTAFGIEGITEAPTVSLEHTPAEDIRLAAEFYEKLGFFHGPSFQIPGEIHLSPGALWCMAPKVESPLSARLGRLPLALDYAFQLVALFGLQRHGRYSLPAGVKRVWVSSEPIGDRALKVVVMPLGTTEETLLANAVITDAETGAALVVLEGISHQFQIRPFESAHVSR